MLSGAGEGEAGSNKHHPCQDHAARAKAISDRPAESTEREVEEAGDCEDEGNVAAGGLELIAQGMEEGSEGVGRSEAHEHDGEGGTDDHPSVEESWALVG